MRRAGSFDWLLLGVLVPVWVACFALSLRSLRDPPLIPLLSVQANGPAEHPTLINVSRWIEPGEIDLQLGDRLLRVGETDLRGVGPIGFWACFQVEALHPEPVTIAWQRGEIRGETLLPVRLPIRFGPLGPVAFGLTGVLLSLRAPPSPAVRAVSRAFVLIAINFCCLPTRGVVFNHFALALATVSNCICNPVSLRALLSFLRGAAPTSAAGRFGPWLFAAMGPFALSALTGVPLNEQLGGVLWQLGGLTFGVTILATIALGYRRAEPLRRRQLRWLVFGFYAAGLPGAIIAALVLVNRLVSGEPQSIDPLFGVIGWFLLFIPISGFVAIARYNLFDVDRLLSATASYNLLLVVLLGAGLVLVPWFGELSSQSLGIDPRMGQVALSLALAAVVVPANQRLRPRIDQLFFRERHALDEGMAELLRGLSACRDARTLTRRVGEDLHRLLRPEACVVYAAAGEGFAPVFAEGRGVPPAFDATSPLIATLRARHRPLSLSAAGRTPDAAALGPFDRAALEALEAEVDVPVHGDEALLAFLCLGPKRSGDVYTSTDLSHLASLAQAVTGQLRRFDQEQTLREAREMQESLRRYVPGAIAEQLVRGAELAPAEREVSVLFVDLRGYTSFAAARRAEEIFSTVNRYTETVSQVVGRHGGSVVEFNGDGMMVVFGAPTELPDKECAAVAAGREILAAVGALEVEPRPGEPAKLSVGVGIATGEAFVGSLRAADRLIWSAIGNTTNLAARLQGLTRELDAALVIDAATRRALGEAGRDLVRRPGVAIRGRERAEEVYYLPLGRE